MSSDFRDIRRRLAMNDYEIEIKETLVRKVKIKAESLNEAKTAVETDYYSGKIVLTADDFCEVVFVD